MERLKTSKSIKFFLKNSLFIYLQNKLQQADS